MQFWFRVASATADRQTLNKLQQDLSEAGQLSGHQIEVLGPIDIRSDRQVVVDEARLLIKYPYAATLSLANVLREAQVEASGATKALSARSGRAVRPIRVRMDETQVI